MIKNLIVISAAWFSACTLGKASPPPDTYQGVVELEETQVAFETAGRVRRLTVEKGDLVQPDQLLAELDDELARVSRSGRVMEAEAARSQSALVQARAKAEDIAALAARVRAAQAAEALLTKNLARQKALFESSAVSAASLDELTGQLDRARADREAAQAQLAALERGARREERDVALARAEAAEAALSLEDERIARMTLKAPRKGRVLDRFVEIGEVVAGGAPVYTLGDTERPYVDVFVPQGQLSGIQAGSRAELHVDSETRSFSGVVEHVSRRTEFTPRYLFSEQERPHLVVRVRLRFQDPGERLHAGVPAFVHIARDQP
ncbi:MAG TPA: HlyD family efflux transporter periplasmic adaptor subunit [Polyangiaceae bacterium]|nr:HlyD family efflux transporter periplasmic adaptor subunit [Polyangiaceae bacterium]